MIYYCNLRLSANPEDAEYIISRHQNFYEVVRYKKINKRFRLHRIFAKINPARDNYTASDWIDIINCKADEPSKLPDIILKYPRPKKNKQRRK